MSVKILGPEVVDSVVQLYLANCGIDQRCQSCGQSRVKLAFQDREIPWRFICAMCFPNPGSGSLVSTVILDEDFSAGGLEGLRFDWSSEEWYEATLCVERVQVGVNRVVDPNIHLVKSPDLDTLLILSGLPRVLDYLVVDIEAAGKLEGQAFLVNQYLQWSRQWFSPEEVEALRSFFAHWKDASLEISPAVIPLCNEIPVAYTTFGGDLTWDGFEFPNAGGLLPWKLLGYALLTQEQFDSVCIDRSPDSVMRTMKARQNGHSNLWG